MKLGYDGLCFAQRSKPPLDLKVFISSDAFHNSPFFYEQLEFILLLFVLCSSGIQSRSKVDTTGGQPIMLYKTLLRSLAERTPPCAHPRARAREIIEEFRLGSVACRHGQRRRALAVIMPIM